MSFFTARTPGNEITGEPDKSFTKEFDLIPNNTTSIAAIHDFKLVERVARHSGQQERFYEITWRIKSEAFYGQQVSQKIKCFEGTPEQIDRNLNMLLRIFQIAEYVYHNADAPSNHVLKMMIGKVMGIKIREWQMPNGKGGVSQGNFVSEVHSTKNFLVEIGVKLEVHKPTKPIMPNSDPFQDDDISF